MTRPSPRLYLEEQSFASGNTLVLQSGQAHHITKVLRLKDGDNVRIFNGQDGEWQATLSIKGKEVFCIAETQMRAQNTLRPCYLYFCPLKPDALHFLIEKATELGVTHLYPILSDRTVARHIKIEKLKTYAEQAAVQCERLCVPQVFEPHILKQLKDISPPQDIPFLLGDERLKAPPLLELLPKGHQGFAILIGPEGGFTPQEFIFLESLPVTKTTFSPHILRAETAAIAALAIGQSVV